MVQFGPAPSLNEKGDGHGILLVEHRAVLHHLQVAKGQVRLLPQTRVYLRNLAANPDKLHPRVAFSRGARTIRSRRGTRTGQSLEHIMAWRRSNDLGWAGGTFILASSARMDTRHVCGHSKHRIFLYQQQRPFCSRRLFNTSNCYWSVEIFFFLRKTVEIYPQSFSYLPREMGISVKASILASGVQPWLVQNQSSSCRTSIADMIELLIVLNYIGCQEVTTDNATIAWRKCYQCWIP